MEYKVTSNNHILLRIIAVVMLLISGFYVIYSARVGTAQVIYFKAKNGPDLPVAGTLLEGQNNDILSQCRKAHRLYPYNYRLFMWAAEETYERSQNATGADKDNYIHLTETLCDKGLALNPYLMPLPYIKMQLLCRTSVRKGTEYWEKYVEWDYWNSYNHAVLAGLYAVDGRFVEAMTSLKLIKGTEDFKEANKIVQSCWAAGSAIP